jgi:hypothetical protein
MKCSACGCPGAYALLRGVICWNRKCRNYHSDVVEGSEFSKGGELVNGDPVSDLKKFLNDDDENPNPFG